ncbi:2Fe-2S iron-sulfur cluster binding domain-containing protein [Nonomuraea sp. NPDC046802]|uniref:2Fe-2S iron-sulfur cluster-binding protein n=1 Tax=Nonomuraea sp. NPDC046802 TaxID=3154919 RepID=UPI0033E51AB2
MLTAVEALMPQACPTGSLHVERFSGRGDAGTGGEEFEVELAQSGQVLTVPAEQRLLDVLREVAPAPDAACEEGFCGSCAVPVLTGTPEHRDEVPGPHEGIIYPCVSRASDRLVIDV